VEVIDMENVWGTMFYRGKPTVMECQPCKDWGACAFHGTRAANYPPETE
jgi:hypothetical protein